MSTYLQERFLNLGLNLKAYFLYSILKSLNTPSTLTQILTKYPILDLQKRQYTRILNSLEANNLLTKEKVGKGLIFRFPYLSSVKNVTYKKLYLSQKCLQIVLNKSQKSPKEKLLYYILNNNLKSNKIIYNKHLVVDKNSPFVKTSKQEVSYLKEIKTSFKKAFPDKNNFIKAQVPSNFNINLLLEKIKQSPFLVERSFVNLNWCIKNYEAIISDYYKPYNQEKVVKSSSDTFSSRQYSQEFFDSLYDNLDDVEV